MFQIYYPEPPYFLRSRGFWPPVQLYSRFSLPAPLCPPFLLQQGKKRETMCILRPEEEPCETLNPLQLYFLSTPWKIKIAERLLFSLKLCS
jgi:hypothetical protein